MISCTEFIPSYSELFSYLEERGGKEEIRKFWSFLFEPTGDKIPLINFLKKEGIRGCFSYWKGTLSEEASDVNIYLNEKAGWFMCEMYSCPSKGRLLRLKEEIGIEPYPDYCLHCDYYRAAAEKAGLNYIWNFNGVDHASCSWLITDPKVFDGRIIMDENTEILEVRAAEREYFHPDFHSSMNSGLDYVGSNYGEKAIVEYLTRFTKNVYHPTMKAIREEGLKALEAKILDTYEKEKTPDAVQTVWTDDKLTVEVAYCPAVKHLRATGREVTRWFRYTTEVVMDVLAKAGDFTFTMESYEEETGKARYTFSK